MIVGVGVSGVGRDDVCSPAKQATGADPEPRCDDQPQDAGQDAPVIELADAGDDRTQNSCQSGITHSQFFTSMCLSYARRDAKFLHVLDQVRSRYLQGGTREMGFSSDSLAYATIL